MSELAENMVRGSLWMVSRDPILPGVQNWGIRLGLIVSNDAGNYTNESVLIAWCSTKVLKGKASVNIPIEGDWISPSVVLCNQIATVTKEWLREYRGRLTDAQMRDVDKGLCQALDLMKTQIYQDALTQKEEAEEKYREALRLIARQDLLLEALRFHLREGTASSASLRSAPSPKGEGLRPAPKASSLGEAGSPSGLTDEATPVDINSASEEDLRALGFSEANIESIIYGRPFSCLRNLQNYLKLTDAVMVALKPKIVIAPFSAPKQEPQPLVDPEEAPPEEVFPLRVHETKPAALSKFLVERGFRKSHVIGLRSAILRYRGERGELPGSIDQLSPNSRLTPKTLYRLSQLEKDGVISLD